MDNCKNHTLKVAALNHSRFRMRKIDDKWVGMDGRDFEILTILSDKMDFLYELVTPDDKQWGSCDDQGNCTGIIGMVARREADMAISSMTPTEARERGVQFSSPYFQDEIIFVTRKPDTQLDNSVFFAKPFEFQVWILLAGFLTIFIMLIKILERFKILQPKLFRVKNLLAIILRQDASLKMATKRSESLFILAFLLVSVGCAGKMYECLLTSETTLNSATKPLDTLEDMADAIQNQGYDIGVPRGIAAYYQVMSSNVGYLKIFANSMRKKGFETHQTTEEGLIRTLHEKYATIEASTVLRKSAIAAGLDLSKFHFASDYLFLDPYAVTYGRNFHCKDAINKWLVVLAGSDLMTKWEMKINWKMEKATATDRPNQKYIDFNELNLVLFGLINGYALATVAVIVEMTVCRICT